MTQLLTIGTLQVSPEYTFNNGPTLGGWAIKVGAVGNQMLSFGSFEPIEVVIESLIRDGSIVRIDGHGNRVVSFPITVRGDSQGMADAEAALDNVLWKPNTMSWTARDESALPTGFEIVSSRKDFIFEDLAEQAPLSSRRRVFLVELTCKPFTIDISGQHVVPALTAGGTTTTSVDAGSSTSGWTGSSTVSVVTGTVGCTDPDGARWLQRSGVVSMVGLPYLVVTTVRPATSWNATPLVCLADGVELELLTRSRVASGSDWVDTWTFLCLDTSVSTFRFEISFDNTGGTGRFAIDQISKSDVAPGIGTGRQRNRIAQIRGTARTYGDIVIRGNTTNLGDVLCYMYDRPDAEQPYNPSLRVYRTSGPTPTSDTGMVSGARDDIQTTTTFEIPFTALPDGGYNLLAKLRQNNTTARTVTWTTQAKFDGALVGSAESHVVTVDLGQSSAYEFVDLGDVTLPLFRTPPNAVLPTNGVLVLTITASLSTQMDDGWLFNIDIGELIQVAAGALTYVFITAPTTDDDSPGVFIGDSDNMLGAHYPSDPEAVQAWGFKELTPPDIGIFSVSTVSANHEVELTYTGRYKGHVTGN